MRLLFGKYDTKNLAENFGALEHRHYDEFICSYHRRREAERNRLGGWCVKCRIKPHKIAHFVALDVALGENEKRKKPVKSRVLRRNKLK